MVKILHFVSTPAICSGVMSTIMNYYRHIDRSSIQFDFLCFVPAKQSYEEEIRELGGRVFFVSKPGSSPGAIRELRKFFQLRGKEYHALHNHEVYLSFFLGPLAKRCGVERFIIHSHATKYSDKKLSAVRNAVLCTPIRFMKCEKIACSKDAGRFLYGERAVENGSVKILHNAIQIDKYLLCVDMRAKIRKKLGLENCFVIGHVGRFMPQKNHDFLIDVFARLSQNMPEARLILIGDGPMVGQIKRKCQKMGIKKKVIFTGQQADVFRWYSAMDTFAFPSVYEGIGIALLEAQANGLSCLVSDQIPREAKVMDSVTFLPLKIKFWERKLLDLGRTDFIHPVLEQSVVERRFRQEHYDIEIESQWLQKYYENTNTDVNI